MTLCQRAALISADARLLYRRLDNLEKDQAPLDKEQAEGSPRRIWDQITALIIQFQQEIPR
jgi:hypothetical protein